MKRYVLGPSSARGLKKLLTGEMLAGRGAAARQGVIDDAAFPMPFTVQWASSLADTTSGSETSGEWIIYLPGTVHVVCNDTLIDLATSCSLEEAGGDYPTGWFKLGNALMPRETGGNLWVNVNTDAKTATMASSGTAATTVSVQIATTAVDSTTTARTVKQLYLGMIVVGGGDSEQLEYGSDGFSIQQCGGDGRSDVRHFQIKGFGRYNITGLTEPAGTFQASQELSVIEGDSSEVAFLVRTGNQDSVGLNSIGYRTLKLTHNGSSPFEYTKTTTDSLTTHQLVNCSFYWNGTLKTLADYDCSSVIANGTIYLTATQAAPSAEAPDPEWTFALATAVATAPSGGKALNWKLYDFAQSKVAVDYRTSFLALEDTTQKAKITVAKPGSSTKIELDASGDTPKVVVTDGTKSVTIDLADLIESVKIGNVVNTVNSTAVGDVSIIGGKYIRVDTSGKTIKISYDPNKTTEDEDPNAETTDPCDHPGGGGAGGVSPDDSSYGGGGDGGGGDGDGDGGVEADGEVHAGDPCNSDDCVVN